VDPSSRRLGSRTFDAGDRPLAARKRGNAETREERRSRGGRAERKKRKEGEEEKEEREEGRKGRRGWEGVPPFGRGTPNTMVATNQRDYATAISHMDMAGSHDKSSCRSATINNNIWTAGWRDGCRDSPSLNSVTRSPAPAIGASCYLAARPSPPASPILLRAMRAVPCAIINRSASDATRGTRAGIPRGTAPRRFGRHARAPGRRFARFAPFAND